ncbi:MAG: hypothetical protein IPF67_09005 [Saprospiraceae bacterium]|nr:hypothetical protein [Candidatus Brachybacter algidus]
MKYNNIIILILMVVMGGNILAQNEIPQNQLSDTARIRSHGATSRATNDRIILRWAPSDFNYWDMGNTYGYNIEKIAFKSDPFNTAIENDNEDVTWRKITETPLKPWTLDQYKVASKDTTNKYLDIEKSEDGKSWKKLNKRPYVSSFEKNEKAFIYVDSMVVNNKNYSYRLRGYTPFGDQGLYSEIIKSTPIDLTPPAPAYSIKASDNGGAVKIEWEATPNEPDFDGFYVGRSGLPTGGFVKISKKLDKKERAFIDFQANPLEDNYYAIFSVDKSGNESMSYVDLGYIVDSLPPEPPTGMKGSIDTSGLVKISWNRGPEADIIGYRVYWANDTLAEFSQLTGEVFAGTIYGDSINIKTLSEYAYYKIVAVDHRYNHSQYSKILKLQKPDIVPPAAPLISKYEQGQLTVSFSWINSSSDDVVNHTLERKFENEEWKKMAVFTKNEKEYTDKDLLAGKSYAYRIVALDDAGNKSISKDLEITAVDRGKRENIQGFKVVNKDGNSMLEWKYEQTGNYVFVIYKQNASKTGFDPIGRLKNTEKTYQIQNVNDVYGIKAIYSDGGESRMETTN